MYYDVNALSESQQYILKLKKREISREKIAERIN
jgi:hypothetical protein